MIIKMDKTINKVRYRKMNKKGLEFKLLFFALIIGGMCLVAIGDWFVEWDGDYNTGLTYDLNEYNKLDSIVVDASSMQEKIGIKTADSTTDFEGTSIRGVWGILNNIFNSFRILFGENGMIDSISDRFRIPTYIGQTLVTLIVIAIVFTLAAVLFRLSRRNV